MFIVGLWDSADLRQDWCFRETVLDLVTVIAAQIHSVTGRILVRKEVLAK